MISSNAKESIKEKGTQKSAMFSISAKINKINCQRDSLIIPMIFIFLSCLEKAHDNKEFSREYSKPRRNS